MPLYTDHYRLWIIQEGEPLDPLEDSKRFYTIDRQLLGLFQVFGNGVLSGWDVSAAGGLSVSISPGNGFINYTTAMTDSAFTLDELLPNSTLWIYAQATEETRYSMLPNFFSDLVYFDDGQQILLGKVTTNSSSVTSVDLTFKQDISYLDTIRTLINSHRHRGGSQNPSKIDLTSEVIGQLPSYRIGSIDAASITSGKIPVSRIPLLNHSTLKGVGVLTHAQLDAFVRDLSDTNVRLLGELGGSNLLQFYLASKHFWNDVDKHAYNMVAMIPGISPDEFTDYAATTAIVDTYNHTIQGMTSGAGSYHSTTFSTTSDFEASQYRVNVEIYGGTSPYLVLGRPTTELIVENFDNVFQTSIDVPGWTLETLADNSQTSFQSDSGTAVDGSYSGQLNVDQGVKLQVTKLFDSSVNWQAYNEIEAFINCSGGTNHGIVNLEILGGSIQQPVSLLEIPLFTSVNEETEGWIPISQDISSLSRSNIVGIRISTTSANGWDLSPFVMNIDKIRLNNNLYYVTEGRIRFRYKTPQVSSWMAISWDCDLNGGEVLSRARSASSYEVFDTSEVSTFSPFSSTTGYNPGIGRNRCFEVEMVVRSNATKTASPVLRSVSVTYLTQAEESSIVVDTEAEFDLGEYVGTQYSGGKVTVPSSRATHYYWCNGNVSSTPASASDKKLWDKLPPAANAEYPVTINTSGIPKSPWMAIISSPTSMNSDYKGLGSLWCPTYVHRKDSTSYFVADTLNDRVMVIDQNGDLVRGYYSNAAGYTGNGYSTYPTTCCYNPRTGRVQITLGQTHYTGNQDPPIDVGKIDLVGSGGFSLNLANDTYVEQSGISYMSSSSYINAIIVELSASSKASLDNYLGDPPSSKSLYMTMDPETFFFDVDGSYYMNLVGEPYLAVADPSSGALKVFVGDYTLIHGIHRPVCVSETEDGNWLVCNAQNWGSYTDTNYSLIQSSVASVSYYYYSSASSHSTSSISAQTTMANQADIKCLIELDLTTDDISYSSNSLYFNCMTRGCAYDVGGGRLLVAGLYYNSGTPSFPYTYYYSDWRGSVRLIDKASGIPEMTYNTTLGSSYYWKPSDAALINEGGTDYVYFSQIDLKSPPHIGSVKKIRVSDSSLVWESTYAAGSGYPLSTIRSLKYTAPNTRYVLSS